MFAWRSTASLRALEVETVEPDRRAAAARAAAGTPVLTASGYLVARREAIVSSKIQGRLSELRVEEGSVVQEGEILARLESTDYVARSSARARRCSRPRPQVGSAQAAGQRAEADLAEAQRQLGVAERSERDKLLALDSLDAARSRVRWPRPRSAQARPTRSAPRPARDAVAGRRCTSPRRSCRTRSSRRRLPAPS